MAAMLSWAVLFGTLHAALSVPGAERLSPLAQSGRLDYSIGPFGFFSSLRDAFVARILGLEPAGNVAQQSVTRSTDGDGSLLAGPVALPLSRVPGRLPRTVVEHPFDNDAFRDAHPVSAIPFTGKTDTRSAGRESGEPDACEPAGGTVWYRYRPNRNMGLLATTFGSDHAVALGVFTGENLTDLTLVDCDVHTEGNAQVVFPAKRNRSYFFQLAAPIRGGELVFSLDPVGTTSMVSVAYNGRRAVTEDAVVGGISATGRYVSFTAHGTDVVRRKEKKTCYWRNQDGHDCFDVYVRDMVAGRTELVSKNSRGASTNGVSGASSISGDGRYVAFWSWGNNLVPRDNNDAGDFFVHDRVTNKTERVSVSSEEREGTIPWAGNRICKQDIPSTLEPFDRGWPELCKSPTADFIGMSSAISSDGRFVAFASPLHGLVSPEPPHCTDLTTVDAGGAHGPSTPLLVDVGPLPCRQVYIRDRKTGQTRLVSVSSDGTAGNGDSAGPFISSNGRWIAFSSSAPNLVANDTNGYRDVFIHDLRTGTTELASTSTWGELGDAQSGGASQRGHQTISDNGRWVAFVSHASNLHPEDGNFTDDVFLKDRRTGETIMVTDTEDSPSSPLDYGSSGHSSMSANGRYIGFTSDLGDRSEGRQELFVYDRVTRTITRISVTTSGEPCKGTMSHEPEISADGHFVAFNSDCYNLDNRYRDDTDALDWDVFVHELPWVR